MGALLNKRPLAIYSLLCALFLTISGSVHVLAFSLQPSIQTIQQGIPGLGIPAQQQEQQQQQQQPQAQPSVPPAPQPPPPSLPPPSVTPPPAAISPPPSPPTASTIPQQQQQQEGTAAASEGIIARGIIDSLIYTPSEAWIATGNWTIGVNNGAAALVTANMTWYNDNGTASHTHEILNFRPGGVGALLEQSQQQPIITVQPEDKSVSLRGIVDVGTNHRIVWNDVQSTIDIKKGGKILAISLNDTQTNNHFGGQTMFGIVTSFIRCSDVPGPNMEVLPPCLNIPVVPTLSATAPPSPSLTPAAPVSPTTPPTIPANNTESELQSPTNFTASPSSSSLSSSPASNATAPTTDNKSPFDILGGG